MKQIRWPLAAFTLFLSVLIIAIADPFNTPPIFLAPADDQVQLFTERDFELGIEVKDIDDDLVRVSAHNLPEWICFDPYLMKLEGRPEKIDKGEYYIMIKADDGRVVRSKMIRLEVDYGHSAGQHLEASLAHLYETETPGLLGASAAVVTPDGELFSATSGKCISWSKEPLNADYRYRIASVSKLFTAALILRLAEEGKLELDGHLSDYLELGRLPYGKEITIRQLLSHTSGMIDHLNHPSFYRGNWKYQTWSTNDILQFASLRRARFRPGEGYAYSNTGYYLLGVLAEKILQQPLGEAYKEWIFEPLGLQQTIYDDFSTRRNQIDSLAQNGRAYEYHQSAVGAAGAIISTPRDMARFGQALFTGKLISASSLEQMKEDLGAAAGGDHYGLGLRMWDDNGIIHIGHTGALMGYRSILMYLPEYNITIAVTTNDSHYQWYGLVNGLLLEMADYYR